MVTTMETQTLKKLRWFWAWEDEQEEAWLRQMSQAGWHLESVGLPGLYTFRQGEPRDYVYRLDFNSNRAGFLHYVQLFQDAGWQHLLAYGNWQYFRKEARPGENPEIFTDNASKVTKYRRVLFILVVILPLLLSSLNPLRQGLRPELAGSPVGVVWLVIELAYLGFLLLLIYGILRLLWRIGQLKRMKQ